MKTNWYIIIFLGILVTACNGDKQQEMDRPGGTMYAVSDRNMEEVYSNMVSSINQNADISILGEIDFDASARQVQSESGPAKTILFGNPNLGTNLMNRNQLAALDLPLRVLFYEQNGDTHVLYNSVEYLEARYNLQGAPELDNMRRALENMVNNATGDQVRQEGGASVVSHEGIVSVVSDQDFQRTYRSLRESVTENANFTNVKEVDHGENARGAGMQLRPTVLLLVSNPYTQSHIVKNNLSAGLDWPNKMLVWEDESGTVRISYNDPHYVQQRHDLGGSDIEIAETADALRYIADYAARDIEDVTPQEGVEAEFGQNTGL